MHRERLEDLISGKLDGELTEQERVELDLCLQNSPEARALLESYLKQAEALKALPSSRMSESDKAAFLARVKSTEEEGVD